jgi:hypothetical protein
VLDLEGARTRLREWGAMFRDHGRKASCGSAERGWASPQIWEAPGPRPSYDLLRAVATWYLVRQLPNANHWSLTVRYCWRSSLPPAIGFRYLRKRIGYPVDARVFSDLVFAGELRVAALIDADPHQPAVPRPSASVVRSAARAIDAAASGAPSRVLAIRDV